MRWFIIERWYFIFEKYVARPLNTRKPLPVSLETDLRLAFLFQAHHHSQVSLSVDTNFCKFLKIEISILNRIPLDECSAEGSIAWMLYFAFPLLMEPGFGNFQNADEMEPETQISRTRIFSFFNFHVKIRISMPSLLFQVDDHLFSSFLRKWKCKQLFSLFIQVYKTYNFPIKNTEKCRSKMYSWLLWLLIIIKTKMESIHFSIT